MSQLVLVSSTIHALTSDDCCNTGSVVTTDADIGNTALSISANTIRFIAIHHKSPRPSGFHKEEDEKKDVTHSCDESA